jgi:3-dehydroquinate dehydratase/shikimate dehydrogenase
MAGVPGDLESRLSRLARNSREIPKAAVTPGGAADLARLLRAFEATRGLQKILLGMGEFGFCTRVLAAKLGSRLCYSSAPGGNAAAGHLDPRTLSELYRFHLIGGDTEVFGLIGNPIAHSRSPLIHNTGFAALGRNAVYVPFLVDDVAAFLDSAEILGVQGLSVTIPHKQSVLPFLTRPDDLVKSVGACNTMVKLQERKGWAGMNTDAEGFLSPLRECFGGAIPPALRVTVIGAGGASRAVVSALKTAGAEVLILNRTADKARELAGELHARWAPLDADGLSLMDGYSDVIVQATSVGMGPESDRDPLPLFRFTGRELVYDLVYDPPVTHLLAKAREAGCMTISGRRMLLSQASAQFRLFTGCPYPEQAAAAVEAAWKSGD